MNKIVFLKDCFDFAMAELEKAEQEVQQEIKALKVDLAKSQALLKAKDQIIVRQAEENQRLREKLQASENYLNIVDNMNKIGSKN
jgi:Na+/phosphate symporter